MAQDLYLYHVYMQVLTVRVRLQVRVLSSQVRVYKYEFISSISTSTKYYNSGDCATFQKKKFRPITIKRQLILIMCTFKMADGVRNVRQAARLHYNSSLIIFPIPCVCLPELELVMPDYVIESSSEVLVTWHSVTK